MKQRYGIDMDQTQYSKTVDRIPVPDVVISMGCDVGCPYIGRPFDDNWQLPDPTGEGDEAFEAVMEEIHRRILELKGNGKAVSRPGYCFFAVLWRYGVSQPMAVRS